MEGTNIFQKDLENTSGLFVDQTRDTLHTASTSETADGRLRDALDVVAQDLAVTLCAALAETLKSKSALQRTTETISNGPFHPFRGQTLRDEVICERRDEDVVCVQRVAGMRNALPTPSRACLYTPTGPSRDWVVDGCLAGPMSRVTALMLA